MIFMELIQYVIPLFQAIAIIVYPAEVCGILVIKLLFMKLGNVGFLNVQNVALVN